MALVTAVTQFPSLAQEPLHIMGVAKKKKKKKKSKFYSVEGIAVSGLFINLVPQEFPCGAVG